MTKLTTARRFGALSKRATTLATSALALAAVAMPQAAQAQDGDLEIKGKVRVRYETFDGGFRPGGVESDDALLLRTVIGAKYKLDGVTFGATVQDSRAYDNDAATPLGTSDINALELIEIYANVALGEDASVTVGRQIIELGSERLVGNPNYRNTSNSFTGARFDWTGNGQFTAFAVMPQTRLPGDKPSILDNDVEWDHEGDDLVLWGLFYQTPDLGGVTGEAYIYGLEESDRPGVSTRDRSLFTPGVRIFTDKGKGQFDGEFEGALQMGNISTSKTAGAPQVDVNAWTLHAEVGYTFDADIKPRFSILGDIATGDDAGSTSYNTFDPLFGPRYGDWGPSGLFGPLGRTNIRSLGAKVEAKFSPAVDAFVMYRQNWLDSPTDAFAKTKVADPTGLSARDAGAQVHARLRWTIVPGLQLETGGGWLGKGDFFDTAPNDPGFDNTRYVYSSLEYKFAL